MSHGVNTEYRQAAMALDAKYQKRKNNKKQARELDNETNEAEVKHNVSCNFLELNKEVEIKFKSKTESSLLKDILIPHSFYLSPPEKFERCIHISNFTGKLFLMAKVTLADNKLNNLLVVIRRRRVEERRHATKDNANGT